MESATENTGLRRDFKIDDDVTEPVPDYEIFKQRLEHLKYAGRLAPQEPESMPNSPAVKAAKSYTHRKPGADPADEGNPDNFINVSEAK